MWSLLLFSQKKIIDNYSSENWIRLKEMKHNVSSIISNDGQYVAYKYDSKEMKSVLVIQSINGVYKKELQNVSEVAITEDSKKLICILVHDSLAILTLGTSDIHYIRNVKSFTLSTDENGKWLAYQLTDSNNTLVLKDLSSDYEKNYINGDEYRFNDNGTSLIIKSNNTIIWVDLLLLKDRMIYNGSLLANLVFDNLSKQIAFTTAGEFGVEIHYYSSDMDSSIMLVNNHANGMPIDMQLTEGRLRFSANGTSLYFQMEKRISSETNNVMIQDIAKDVEIWHSKDPFLPLGGLPRKLKNESFLAVSKITNPKVIQLRSPDISLIDYCGNNNRNNYVLAYNAINIEELYWNKEVTTLYLISTRDGSKKEITSFNGALSNYFLISPKEHFVVWFNNQDKCYYSYEISTSIIRNISSSIKVPVYDDESDILDRRKQFGVAGWKESDSSLFLYDRYDIWQVDPSNKKKPINITNGYGRSNSIIYRRVEKDEIEFEAITKDSFLLAGFNTINKENGFWNLNINNKRSLQKCIMGQNVYYFPRPSWDVLIALSEDFPQKAKYANLYVVRRMSAKESPNLFITSDFKNFNSLTNIHPEREYNWMSTKLIKWNMPGGKISEGILYKPENFDSTKKYPIIFYYYEKLSDMLYVYETPELSNGMLNIPWYVSNGYLVFIPNMYYKMGEVEKTIVESITSAVKRISEFRYIDISKMGLQGHSFGGFETVTIITHTNIFAAAQESSGLVNSISYYSQPIGFGSNRNHYFDLEHGSMGCSPWDNPELYIKNSPIFYVHNITTPLMIMHNKADGNVPFAQGIELFTALRRLRKDAWLLQYTGENHIINNRNNRFDFSIRQQQFFDHYLKGSPMPKWMSIVGNNSFDLDFSSDVFRIK
jgi:dienelactone hydrolase